MKPNVDVDRISLEERIANLERRIPSGPGGVSLGLYPSLDELDALPDNSFSLVNQGVAFKCTIHDFSQLGSFNIGSQNVGPILHGVEFKILSFWPKFEGMYSTIPDNPLCPWYRVRCRITRPVGMPSQTHASSGSLSASDVTPPTPIEGGELVFEAIQAYERSQSAGYSVQCAQTANGLFFTVAQGGTSAHIQNLFTRFFLQLTILPPGANGKSVTKIGIVSISFNYNKFTVQPCYAFGWYQWPFLAITTRQAIPTIGGGIYSGNYAGCDTVYNPQDLTPRCKSLYPASWVV